MEANCLEIASLISVLLKDALALIRIVNAARSVVVSSVAAAPSGVSHSGSVPSPSTNAANAAAAANSAANEQTEVDKTVVSRLYQNLKALEAWAQSEW